MSLPARGESVDNSDAELYLTTPATPHPHHPTHTPTSASTVPPWSAVRDARPAVAIPGYRVWIRLGASRLPLLVPLVFGLAEGLFFLSPPPSTLLLRLGTVNLRLSFSSVLLVYYKIFVIVVVVICIL